MHEDDGIFQQKRYQNVAKGTYKRGWDLSRHEKCNNNVYGALDDDNLEEYGNYPSSWILDSGASGNYAPYKSLSLIHI